MSTAPDFDVLIVGAGPAGAHTALRLAARGYRVGLLDARRFPRPKLCGEFLSPACLPALEELGLLEPLLEADAARVEGMEIHSPHHSSRGRYLDLGRHRSLLGHGLGVRREVLDTLTATRAAAHPQIQALYGWRAVTPTRASEGRVTGLEVRDPEGDPLLLRCRFLVAADGLHSRIARSLGWSRPTTAPPRFALVAPFRAVPERRLAGLHVLGRNYFAACPVDAGRYTANLVVDRGAVPPGAAALAELFTQRLHEAPRLAALLGAGEPDGPVRACGPLGARVSRVAGPGAALVGDAAGFVDPMTGEGLYFAMRGAELLAPCLDQALREPGRETRALRRYARRRRREFAPRQALARLLQRGLQREGLPDRVVGLLARHPRWNTLLLGLTGDYLPPHALLDPRVWRSAGALS